MTIVDKVRRVQKQHHDTLYCSPEGKAKILQTSAGLGNRADNLQISGLEVVTHQRFKQPIVCERGQLFDLAEDYKFGDATAEEL